MAVQPTSSNCEALAPSHQWAAALLTDNIASAWAQTMLPQVDWKLLRGKWRPRLLDFAKQADPAAVEAASRAAFQALGSGGGGSGSAGSGQEGGSRAAAEPSEANIKHALAELCVLKVRPQVGCWV